MYANAAKVQIKNIPLSDGLDASIEQYPANGKYIVLFMASGFGFNKNHRNLAESLAKNGLETWMIDMAETLFLSRGSTSLKEIPGKYVAEIIAASHRLTGKKVILISSSYGAIPTLRGAYSWQKNSPEKPYLLGAILFSPNLYISIPTLGTDPEYLPIASATNIPIYILQGDKNGNRWQLRKVINKLSSGGSPVYTELMREIIGLFYADEMSPTHKQIFDSIPVRVKRIISLFESSPAPLTNSNIPEKIRKVTKGLDINLKKFLGNPLPYKIQLKDINGVYHNMEDYKGRITVVNFWATWCPPCIEEIPSLNRLKKKMRDIPFRLVSIDYAENQKEVEKFLKKVKVEFPVLLDTQGKEATKWKVISFPSTFIIGPDGKIHYGVNAALEWDNPEIEMTLRKLLTTK